MIKTIIIDLDELETYLNKPWFVFLCNYQDKFIFKYNDSKKSTELLRDKDLKELIKENFTIDFLKEVYSKYWLTKEDFKNECEMFVLYWEEANANSNIKKWQKEKTFDVKLRFITWMSNNKKWNSNKKQINTDITFI